MCLHTQNERVLNTCDSLLQGTSLQNESRRWTLKLNQAKWSGLNYHPFLPLWDYATQLVIACHNIARNANYFEYAHHLTWKHLSLIWQGHVLHKNMAVLLYPLFCHLNRWNNVINVDPKQCLILLLSLHCFLLRLIGAVPWADDTFDPISCWE